MITQDPLQPPSPVTSDISSDSEKDTTRVFFGPFRSPEKRFAAIAVIPDPELGDIIPISSQGVDEQLAQGLKSSSPSSSTCSEEIMDVERLVALVEEPVGGSEGDVLPDYDEPSSVLASKLLLALDNPSPPPSPTLRMSNGIEEMGREEGTISFGAIPLLPNTPPRGLLGQIDAFPTLPSPSSEPDLMIFDSLDGILEPLSLGNTDPPQSPPPSPFSFPDRPILDSSTMQHTPEAIKGCVDTLIDVQEVGSTSNTSTLIVRGQESPDVGDDHITPSGTEQFTSMVSTSNSLDTTLLLASPPRSCQPSGIPIADDLRQTPLRRSSRPRKSITPHALEYVASPRLSKDQASPLPFVRSSSQTYKNRKGKERAASPSSSDKGQEAEVEHEHENSPFKADGKQSNVKFQRRYSRSPVRRETTRELGSLSPNSADLLTRLIPSVTPLVESTPIRNFSMQESISTLGPSLSSETSNVHIPSSTSQSPAVPESAPNITDDSRRSLSPSRTPITPRKRQNLHSPSKLRFQPASLDDPSRTPARRVPIGQAVAEGRVSPEKLLQMQTGILASVSPFTGQAIPVFDTSLKGDASPARRVFVAQSTSYETTSHPKSLSKDRPTGPESQQAIRRTGTLLQKSMTMPRPAKLPYPLVAPPRSEANPEEKGVKTNKPRTTGSPTKSLLKQTTSRIPRKKPYSKSGVVSGSMMNTAEVPTLRTAQGPKTTGGTNTRKKSLTSAQKATGTHPSLSSSNPDHHGQATHAEVMTNTATKRVIRAVDLSKSTTNKFCHLSAPSAPTETTSLAIETHTGHDVVPATGHLKRKRLDSKIGPVASSRSTTLRQVPVVVPSTIATAPSRPSASTSSKTNYLTSDSRTQPQTANKPVVVKFRRVMPSELAAHTRTILEEPGQSAVPSLLAPAPKQPEIQEAHLSPEKDMTLSSLIKETTIQSSPIQASPPTLTSLPFSPPRITSSPYPPPPPPSLVFVIDPLSPVSDTTPESADDNSPAPNVRRTTRLRKPTPIQPSSDTLNNDLNAISLKTRTQQRRRSKTDQNLRSNTDDVLLGMSEKALKSLTAHNTVRNQHYAVANLEMEIVKKEGMRPESPAVKIKTIVQRQQEEKLRQREERAARRAKRHGEGDFEVDENVDDTGHEGASDTSDLPGLHLENAPNKHRRGAGDEEDYETPLKNIDGQFNGQRRVKWDRGLFTEIFLDEVALGTKAPPKESIGVKGCLTAMAKTLPLDTLGNLTDLDKHLLDLTQENVVVKKFVYDDDVDVVLQLQPPPPVAIDRNTRSKSKKISS